MIKFLFGLIFGGVVGGVALAAVAVMNPVPEGPIASGAPAPAPEEAEAPATEAAAEPEPAAAEEPEEPAVATPAEPEDAPEPETEVAAAPAEPEPEPEPAPEPSLPASVPSLGTDGPSLGGGPVAGGANLDAGSTATLGAPNIDTGSGAGGLGGGGGDSSPIRTASVPQPEVTPVPGASGPSVDTESASVPSIGAVGGDGELVEGNALEQYAAPFNGDASKPLMSIVLIDEGENPALRAGLAALTAPITFGVRADMEDASLVAAQYREAGFEISAVAPANTPFGFQSNPGAAEPASVVAEVIRLVPGAATVMDGIGGSLPTNRNLAEAVLEAVKITGHGLLTHRGTGLNNVPLIADEVGVPSEVIFRIIDSEPGSANISLALERAVQDAERGGAVVVVGHVRQETVSTLFSWILGTGARDVTIAPVSAVLQ